MEDLAVSATPSRDERTRALAHEIRLQIRDIATSEKIDLAPLAEALNPILRAEIIPRMAEGWKLAGGAPADDHGQRTNSALVLSKVLYDRADPYDQLTFLDVVCTSANGNRRSQLNCRVMFDYETIYENLPETLSELAVNGNLKHTYSPHSTSFLHGNLVGFRIQAFGALFDRHPAMRDRLPPAFDADPFETSGRLLLLADPWSHERSSELVQALESAMGSPGNINFGIVRERSAASAYAAAGIVRLYTAQGQSVLFEMLESGAIVRLGGMEGSDLLYSEGMILIGDRSHFERALSVNAFTAASAAALIDELIAQGSAAQADIQAGARMRVLIDDDVLCNSGGPDRRGVEAHGQIILAAGIFPMPAMGGLPAGPGIETTPGLF